MPITSMAAAALPSIAARKCSKIADIVGQDSSVEFAVRFVLPRERTSSAHDFSTKFGAPEHIAVALLQDADRRGYVPVLTFHPGSQSRDPQVYARHIEAAHRIAKTAGVHVGKLNVGGGFPATYPMSKPAAAGLVLSPPSPKPRRAILAKAPSRNWNANQDAALSPPQCRC